MADSKKRLLWTISLHHACNDGTLMALVALIPILVKEFDLSYTEVGLLGFGLIITVVAQLAVGKFADRFVSKYLLEIGASMMGLSFVFVLFVNDFPGLFIAVVAMRAGAAFYHPVGISWITREFEESKVETALGVQSGIGNLGVIIALGTSGFLGEALSWKAPCLLWASLNFAAVALGLSVLRKSIADSRTVLRKAKIGTMQTMRKMWLLTVPIVGGGALYQITSYFGPVRLTEGSGWTAGDADLMFAVWIGVGTVTSYYFGMISAWVGKTSVLKYGYLVSAVSVMLLAAITSWHVIAPVLAIYGAFLFLTYPALFALLTEMTDESERGTAFGILFGFQLGGGAVFVYLCGFVADLLGDPSYAFAIAAILSLASLLTILAPVRTGNTRSTGT